MICNQILMSIIVLVFEKYFSLMHKFGGIENTNRIF